MYTIYAKLNSSDLEPIDTTTNWNRWLTKYEAWSGHRPSPYESISYHVFKGEQEIYSTERISLSL